MAKSPLNALRKPGGEGQTLKRSAFCRPKIRAPNTRAPAKEVKALTTDVEILAIVNRHRMTKKRIKP